MQENTNKVMMRLTEGKEPKLSPKMYNCLLNLDKGPTGRSDTGRPRFVSSGTTSVG